MLIVVQYLDEKYDAVIHYRLNDLIGAGRLLGFSSPHGWVRITRPHERGSYPSPASKEEIAAGDLAAVSG